MTLNITDKYNARDCELASSSLSHDMRRRAMRLLLSEHDEGTLMFIETGLSSLGYHVDSVKTILDALICGMDPIYDALIFGDSFYTAGGRNVISTLRSADVDTPILVLAVSSTSIIWPEAQAAGANEIAFAPFPLWDLEARLNAITRKSGDDGCELSPCHGDIRIDVANRTVHRQDVIVDLHPIEFAVLLELVLAKGQPVTSAMLLERIWNFRFTPGTDIVGANVARLRAKLNAGFSHNAIQSLRHIGHRIVADA